MRYKKAKPAYYMDIKFYFHEGFHGVFYQQKTNMRLAKSAPSPQHCEDRWSLSVKFTAKLMPLFNSKKQGEYQKLILNTFPTSKRCSLYTRIIKYN